LQFCCSNHQDCELCTFDYGFLPVPTTVSTISSPLRLGYLFTKLLSQSSADVRSAVLGPAADAAFALVLNFVGFGGGGGLAPVDVVATIGLGTTEGFRVAFEEVLDTTGLAISM